MKRILFIANLIVSNIIFSQSITIGNQVWSSKNLDVTVFRNGDIIPQVKSNEDWVSADKKKQPGWCYYRNNSENGSKYGKLYNWYAVIDPRGLAPMGFHIASDSEWHELEITLGKDSHKKLKTKTGWNLFEGVSQNGDNNTGFSALPGGARGYDGSFDGIGEGAYFWTSTEDGDEDGLMYSLNPFYDKLVSYPSKKCRGLSVRCIKD
jgi:uncharacterized protein (TIGR02145 family)